MDERADDNPTIENPRGLLARAEAMRLRARKLHIPGIKALEKQLGLVSDVTRVRQDDLEGFFIESVNYIDGRLWISVRLDPPLPEPHGRWRKFYGDWSVVG